MARIVTITFNPCIDKSTRVAALAPEKKLLCSEPVFEPGGGGLNVSRVIHKLGGDTLAIFPTGGHSGKLLNELLQKEGVPFEALEVKNPTRENLIVFEEATGQQYRFGMPGAPLLKAEWEQLLEKVKNCGAEYVIASGSLPEGVPTDVFARLALIVKSNGAKFIVDTSGAALKEAVDAGVYLLKPNLSELSSLAGQEEVGHEMVDEIARDIIGRNCCMAIMVSLGAAGARLITKQESIQVIPPVVKRLSTVGAGDSMVAGVVLSLSRGKDLRDALEYGVACGTAATMNPGTELSKPEDVERLYSIIKGIK
ncbi:MAG TPA: 1-phosphofructokinase family hexose kinase [Flavisolibacter sp.]|nr:1-phosphofructokinase family hexose kinase [Flavisolibacter sp.]